MPLAAYSKKAKTIMRRPISFEKFERYAKKLLQNGTPICPCCLSEHLTFTTDEEHTEFWLECTACHIGIRSSLFSFVRKSWENRPAKIRKLHEITHNITCSYWDDDINNTRYVTLPEPDDDTQYF